uniref:Uncharacterized protein n=1 Tax=Arundo donax TaxID=35708 RepID=A0A0A9GUS8_ARUDO
MIVITCCKTLASYQRSLLVLLLAEFCFFCPFQVPELAIFFIEDGRKVAAA